MCWDVRFGSFSNVRQLPSHLSGSVPVSAVPLTDRPVSTGNPPGRPQGVGRVPASRGAMARGHSAG